MNRLRISTRLFLLIGLLLALMATIGAVTLTGLARNASAIDGMLTHSLLPMRDVAQIQERLLRNRLAIAVALVTPDNPTIDRSLKDIEGNLEAIQKTWQDFTGRELDAKDRELAKAFFDARSRFVEYGLRPTMAALASRDIKDAQRLVVDGVRPLYQPVDAAMQALTDWQIESARQQHAEAISGARVARNVSIGLIVGAVLLSGVLGWLLVRTITSALDRAIDVANRVAAGRLDTPVVAPGRDELSTLLRALESMRANLAKTVGDVRSGAAEVATASAQIEQGNVDLSSRTEQQAASLEQTASSVEQLSSTVRQNADNARMADQMAQGAATVATEGGNAVAQMVESMRSIHDNSRRIAEIISLIDGIALQTNILALNAAVEAARAGEHGRGFAVVAAEVRTLAQRSVTAAREIGSLITASVERIEDGTRLADQAGNTMSDVIGSIRKVTDLVGEIASASHEQATAITQVASAVGQMDQVTQQNAALVEQSTAAAASLRQQAERLVDSVAVFRLQDEPHPEVHNPSHQVQRSAGDRGMPRASGWTVPPAIGADATNRTDSDGWAAH